MNSVDELAFVALWAESVRLEPYRQVSAQHEPAGGEEAAREVDVSLRLAAVHPDWLTQAGSLDWCYRLLGAGSGAMPSWCAGRVG